MYCFSGCWYGCWAWWVISWWRRSVWRQNRVPVTSFTFRRFSRSSTKRSRWAEWTSTSSWLWDESGCDKACQQPCSVLHLYDVVSTHESAWSVEQSTTYSYCPVTLYFPLRCHSNSSCQETHLAAVWLQTMLRVLQFYTTRSAHNPSKNRPTLLINVSVTVWRGFHNSKNRSRDPSPTRFHLLLNFFVVSAPHGWCLPNF